MTYLKDFAYLEVFPGSLGFGWQEMFIPVATTMWDVHPLIILSYKFYLHMTDRSHVHPKGECDVLIYCPLNFL